MKNLLKALSEFQKEVPVIHEDTKGYNYTYANLNTIFKTIKPLLDKNGLGFTQLLDGKNLKTIVYHIETGETLEGSVEIETNVKLSSMNHYQVFGSAITYFRRYSLSCVLGLITDKDIDVKGEQVEKPQLMASGYKFLLSSEATKKDIKTALDTRDMTTEQRTKLEKLC